MLLRQGSKGPHSSLRKNGLPGLDPALRGSGLSAVYRADLISGNGLFSFFSSTNLTSPVTVSIT